MYLTKGQIVKHKKLCRKLKVSFNEDNLNIGGKFPQRYFITKTTKLFNKRVFISQTIKNVYSKYVYQHKKVDVNYHIKAWAVNICRGLSSYFNNKQLLHNKHKYRKVNINKYLAMVRSRNQRIMMKNIFNDFLEKSDEESDEFDEFDESEIISENSNMNPSASPVKSVESLSKDCSADFKPVILSNAKYLRNKQIVDVASLNDCVDNFSMNVKKEAEMISNKNMNALYTPNYEIESTRPGTNEERVDNRLKLKSPVNLMCSPLSIKMNILVKNEIMQNKNIDDSSSSYSEFYGFESDDIEFDGIVVENSELLPSDRKIPMNTSHLQTHINKSTKDIDSLRRIFKFSPSAKWPSMMHLKPKQTSVSPSKSTDNTAQSPKRVLLEDNEDIRYHMLKNESTIFSHLSKRQKMMQEEEVSSLLHFEQMTSIQKKNIPFTRDAWKALAWLRTERFKHFCHNGEWKKSSFKIIGSKGNHIKNTINFDNIITKKFQNIDSSYCNCPEYPSNLKITLEDGSTNEPLLRTIAKPKGKLRLCRNITDYARPINSGSSKVLPYNKDDEDCFSRTTDAAYDLPQVKLKVAPKLNRPLNAGVKPYLKLILPYQKITDEWAEFSASTVTSTVTPLPSEDVIPGTSKKFSFKIPYRNGQEKIIARDRKAHDSVSTRKTIENFDETLNFDKNLEKNDELGTEVAQIITELTNSVAITILEDDFVQEDPDIGYGKPDEDVQKEEIKKKEEDAKSKINQKVLRELKKLNATIITASDNSNKRVASKCSEKFCDKGCICESLESKVTRYHCGEIDCALSCKCKNKNEYVNKQLLGESEPTSLSNDDLNRLCDKATARLALEERDFAPTVILTDNNTMLVHNRSSNQRRVTKVPKKFSDYESDKPSISSVSVETPKKIEPVKIEVKKEQGPRLNPIFDQLRHVKVNLQRLPDLNHVEPWCMVHCLYKCYCRNQSLSGKIFKFDEDNDFKRVIEDSGFDANDLLIQRSSDFLNSVLNEMEMSKDIIQNESVKLQDSDKDDTIPSQSVVFSTPDVPLDANLLDSIPKVALYYEVSTCVSRRVNPVNRIFHRERNRRKAYTFSLKTELAKEAESDSLLGKRIEQCIEFYRFGVHKKLHNKEAIHIYLEDTDEEIERNPITKPLFDTTKVLICIDNKRYVVDYEENFDSFIKEIVSILTRMSNSERVYVIRRISAETEKDPVVRPNKFYLNIKQIEIYFHDVSDKFEGVEPIFTSTETVINSVKLLYSMTFEAEVNNSHKDPIDVEKITKTIYKIRNMILDNSKKIHHPIKGVMYMMQWSILLEAFEEKFINIYEVVKFSSAGEKKLLITDFTCTIEQTKFLQSCGKYRNLREGRIGTIQEDSSLLSTLLINRMERVSTENLVLLLQGQKDYWLIDGFMKSNFDFSQTTLEKTCADPSVKDALKHYYTTLTEEKVIDKKENANDKNSSSISKVVNENQKPIEVVKKHQKSIEVVNKHQKSIEVVNKHQKSIEVANKHQKSIEVVNKPQKSVEVVNIYPKPTEGVNKDQKLIEGAKESSPTNIRIIENDVDHDDVIKLPTLQNGCEWYFVLTFVNDFSELYVPSWNAFVSYDKILYAIEHSQKQQKIFEIMPANIKTGATHDFLVKIYAVPSKLNKLYIGPYKYNANVGLKLYQNFNGKLFLREDFLKLRKSRRLAITTGSWVYGKGTVNSNLTNNAKTGLNQSTDADESDCMILENDDTDDCITIDSEDENEDMDEANIARKSDETGSVSNEKKVITTYMPARNPQIQNIRGESSKSIGNIKQVNPNIAVDNVTTSNFMKNVNILKRKCSLENTNESTPAKKYIRLTPEMLSNLKAGMNKLNTDENGSKNVLLTNRFGLSRLSPIKTTSNSKIISIDKPVTIPRAAPIRRMTIHSATPEPLRQNRNIIDVNKAISTKNSSNKSQEIEMQKPADEAYRRVPTIIRRIPVTSTITSADAESSKAIRQVMKSPVGLLKMPHPNINNPNIRKMISKNEPSISQRNPTESANQLQNRKTITIKKIISNNNSTCTTAPSNDNHPPSTTNSFKETIQPANIVVGQKIGRSGKLCTYILKRDPTIKNQDNIEEKSSELNVSKSLVTSNNVLSKMAQFKCTQLLKINPPESSNKKNNGNVQLAEKLSNDSRVTEISRVSLESADEKCVSRNLPQKRIPAQSTSNNIGTSIAISKMQPSTSSDTTLKSSVLRKTDLEGNPFVNEEFSNYLRAASDNSQTSMTPFRTHTLTSSKKESESVLTKLKSSDCIVLNKEELSNDSKVSLNNSKTSQTSDNSFSVEDKSNSSEMNMNFPEKKYHKGFIISNVKELGRIRAIVSSDGDVFIKTPKSSKQIHDVKDWYSKYIRSLVLGTIPLNYKFRGYFEDDPEVYGKFENHNRERCTKTIVIGEDMFCDVSKINEIHMHRQYFKELLCYRLLATITDDHQIQKCLFSEIIQLALSHIRVLEARSIHLLSLEKTTILRRSKLRERLASLRKQAIVDETNLKNNNNKKQGELYSEKVNVPEVNDSDETDSSNFED